MRGLFVLDSSSVTSTTVGYKPRQERLGLAMKRAGISALLISHLPNIRYLCGFAGSAGVLVLRGGESRLFIDGRYLEQAKQQARVDGIEVGAAPLAGAARWPRGK